MDTEVRIEIGGDLIAVKHGDLAYEVYDNEMEGDYVVQVDAAIIEAIAKLDGAGRFFQCLKNHWTEHGRDRGVYDTQSAIREALGL